MLKSIIVTSVQCIVYCNNQCWFYLFMGGHGDCVEYIVKNSIIVYGLLTIIIKAVKFLNKEEEKEHEKLY